MTTPLQAFAQFDTNFSDMPADWSTEALETAVNNGLLKGYDDKIQPYDSISRAEVATVINRAFGAHTTVSIDGIEDVQREDWHYSELAKAVAMGTLNGDGNGVYRKDISLDLGCFYNSVGDWQESTPMPLKLKLYVPFENGAPRHDEPVQAVWQTVAQSEAETDPVLDGTSPEFTGISYQSSDIIMYGGIMEREIWIEEGDSIEFQITASDDNLRRMKMFENSLDTVEGSWYYADANVHNGPTDILSVEDEIHGVDVSYSKGIWTIEFGPEISARLPAIIFELDFEDYAGNSWSEVETSLENRTFLFVPRVIDRTVLNEINAEIAKMIPSHYPPEIWVNIETALDMPESTQEEIDDKVDALEYAIKLLPPYIEVESVVINEEYDPVIVGETYSLTATVLPNDATDSSVWWRVMSGPGVIDEDTGEFRATDVGEIVVKAASYSYPIINDTITFIATSPAK